MSHRIVYELSEEKFRESMKALSRTTPMRYSSWPSWWWVVILPSLLVGCIGYIIASEVSPGNETSWTFGGIFISAAFVTAFGQKFLLDSFTRQVIRSKQNKAWDNILCRTEVTLESDRVRSIIPTCETAYVFKYITHVEYKDGILSVICKDRTVLFINKKTITSGDLDAFAEALSEAVKNAKEEPTEIGK